MLALVVWRSLGIGSPRRFHGFNVKAASNVARTWTCRGWCGWAETDGAKATTSAGQRHSRYMSPVVSTARADARLPHSDPSGARVREATPVTSTTPRSPAGWMPRCQSPIQWSSKPRLLALSQHDQPGSTSWTSPASSAASFAAATLEHRSSAKASARLPFAPIV